MPGFKYLADAVEDVNHQYRELEAGRHVHKDSPIGDRAVRFASGMHVMAYRRVFVTQSGYLGIGPLSTQAGDEIWALPDAPLPTMLRALGSRYNNDDSYADKATYSVLGDTFVHGDPDYKTDGDSSRGWEWIELV